MEKNPPKIFPASPDKSLENGSLSSESGASSFESGPSKEIPWKVIVPAFAVVLILASAGAFYYFYYQRGASPAPTGDQEAELNVFSTPAPKGAAAPKPTPTPTPIVLRPDNGTKGTYLISQVKNGGPVVKQVIFDPLDVKKGQSFTVTVIMDAESSAEQITGVFESDTTKKNITFERITDASGIQTWQSKFTVEDSVLWKYMLTFVAKTGDKSSTVTVAPRS